jgi:hypothetical protein
MYLRTSAFVVTLLGLNAFTVAVPTKASANFTNIDPSSHNSFPAQDLEDLHISYINDDSSLQKRIWPLWGHHSGGGCSSNGNGSGSGSGSAGAGAGTGSGGPGKRTFPKSGFVLKKCSVWRRIGHDLNLRRSCWSADGRRRRWGRYWNRH